MATTSPEVQRPRGSRETSERSRPTRKQLRVCHLGKYYPPARGGIETHVRALARSQAELGADVRVICVNHADSLGRDVTWRRVGHTRTVDEQDGPVRVTRVGRIANLARLDVCPSLIPRIVAAQVAGLDVLHIHLPNPTMMLALASLPLAPPLVVSHHSDIVRQRRLRLLIRPLEHQLARRASAILSTSPRYPEGSPLLRRYDHKLRVLPLGIDIASYLDPDPEALAHAAVSCAN